MAKKNTTTDSTPSISTRLKERDARTSKKILDLAEEMVKRILGGDDPIIQIPTRAKSNTLWNKKRGILEMGSATAARPLFDLKTAKQFMQTMLHSNTISELIAAGKTSSLRGVFYKAKHTVAGTRENTFDGQDESDPILEDLEVALGALREELHVFAENRGSMVGNITIVDRGDEINCRKMGSGGYALPSIVEPDIIQFKKCEAKFILHVEKGTVWNRFNEDRFWEKHNCILTHGAGQPPRGCRRLLQRMTEELKLPLICVLDCDPWGHYIYSVIKQGSISLAFESSRLAIPQAKFLGIRAKDFRECNLDDAVKIDLTENDIKRAGEIAAYPWFEHHKGWQREIGGLLKNGFKMEVESLITKDISYVTDTYVPERLKARDWID
ncbi:MAG: DNA topoisomerase IV subunit A [Planctomycetota bacterium]|jgi:DNA topoisomerase VI subunit A|nr:MAG: DNA topoisomerase IV subunit A [Planctomycetota bacterium]RLS95775.1 MAG: DNA topoisomerase IV subunit A [Planctomycetota bacterium]